MKKSLFLFLALGSLAACSPGNQNTNPTNPPIMVQYPDTRRDTTVVDDYHGTWVTDPYRWLEVDTAAEVEAWVVEQNKVTQEYLNQIPYRQQLRDRYEQLFNFPKVGQPMKAGEYYLFAKNDGLQNQAVYYIQSGLEGEPEVFLDPNQLSPDGTISISLSGVSPDNKYIALIWQEAGSDWASIRIMDIATKEELPDRIEWVKFSGAAWYQDGFFYSRYPKPESGAELSGNNQYHSVYYHKLGDPQEKDELILENRERPEMYHMAEVTEDQKYLVVQASPGTDGFATLYQELGTDQPFVTLFPGYSNKSTVIHSLGDRFLVLTDIDAPNYRLIEVNLQAPEKENWKDILPEKDNLLQSVSTGGGYLFASYLQDATSRIVRYAYDGTGENQIELPGTGSASGFSGKEDQEVLFYTFTSMLYPSTIFKYDVPSGTSTQFFRMEIDFDPDQYVEKQVFFTSKDGTRVPMFLVHKKDLVMDGTNPTLLYGYGGFNISLFPYFSTSRVLLLENGGVFAMVNLRGGGEYGEEWHKAGMLLNKQNVFDDFIAAGEYLVEQGYTDPDHLGILGGSNGGLLVGACMTQRPDLFAVAIPIVGVLDMLRYQKFTVGKGWIPEYGSSDEPEHFKNLLAYSPLHNLKAGTEYPATMIMTGDHDDRVVPAHSFKFAAELQRVHEGENPVIIRIETDAGHGAGKPTSKVIEEQTDMYAFFLYNAGVKELAGSE